jgi:hypothetical protein
MSNDLFLFTLIVLVGLYVSPLCLSMLLLRGNQPGFEPMHFPEGRRTNNLAAPKHAADEAL